MSATLKIYDHVPLQYLIDVPDDRTQIPFFIRFGDLDLQKRKNRTILTKGDFSSFTYANHEDPKDVIVEVRFEITFPTDENNRKYLRRKKTPVYHTKEEGLVESSPTFRNYYSADYNSWSKSARSRTYEDLTEWVPIAALMTGAATTLNDVQQLAARWLFDPAYNHYGNFQLYRDTGDAGKAVFLAGLDKDLEDGGNPWLNNVIPYGVIDQLPTGLKIHEMIRLALR